jgi:hypothetical protein
MNVFFESHFCPKKRAVKPSPLLERRYKLAADGATGRKQEQQKKFKNLSFFAVSPI